ncbi:hypothetical protein C8J56DRAFT_237390 [Mycena floridula]|nr:hypothetical protein C8J56DRAFT_237390 [Mycena floridula]
MVLKSTVQPAYLSNIVPELVYKQIMSDFVRNCTRRLKKRGSETTLFEPQRRPPGAENYWPPASLLAGRNYPFCLPQSSSPLILLQPKFLPGTSSPAPSTSHLSNQNSHQSSLEARLHLCRLRPSSGLKFCPLHPPPALFQQSALGQSSSKAKTQGLYLLNHLLLPVQTLFIALMLLNTYLFVHRL